MFYASPDWTLARYAEVLQVAKQRFSFEPFGTASQSPHTIWRHDIDYSVEHALRLGQIEAQHGVRATYFLLLGSPYYNLLDITTGQLLREIVRLGHWIGLHFDPERHPNIVQAAELEQRMAWERGILSDLAAAPVDAVSFHNPAFAGVLHMDDEQLAGMTNAYSARLQKDYAYCSDSFGFWRFRPLHEVVSDAAVTRLHALTHPVWWWDRPMGSRERIAAAVRRDAERTAAIHDDLLQRAGQLDAVIAADRARGFHSAPWRPAHPGE